MKIGMFTDTYLPTVDGVVRSILSFRKELEKRGNKVYIFAPEGNGKDERNVFYCKSTSFKSGSDYRLAVFPTQVKKIVSEKKIDVIHSHSPGPMGLKALLVSYRLKIPLVFTFHTMITDPVAVKQYTPSILHGEKLIPFVQKYLGWYLRKCKAVIAPSNIVKKEIFDKTGFKSIFVVPTGINLNKFHPDIDGKQIRKKLGLDNKKIILSVGRVSREKNLETAIRAFSIVKKKKPNCKLVIVGKGPGLEYYKKMVKMEGIKRDVVFQDFVVPDDILPQYYTAADVFVFPSKFETQGIVAMEAMASGKPVAGANYRAIPEYVQNGKNGFLFDPDNPEDCADAIVKCLNLHSEDVKVYARKTAEEYSIEKCADRLTRVYEYCLQHHLQQKPDA